MKFGTATVFYHDSTSLRRNLESVTPYFDLSICIDGPFLGHRKYAVESGEFIVRQFPHTTYNYIEDITEAQKRNIYLELAKFHQIDWLLILDSDEYIVLHDSFEEFKNNCMKGLVPYSNVYGIHMHHDGIYDFKPRLWYRPWEMIYEGCHYCYHRKDGRPIQTMRQLLPGLTIEHDHNLRTEEYEQNWKEFREYQVRTEGS